MTVIEAGTGPDTIVFNAIQGPTTLYAGRGDDRIIVAAASTASTPR